MVLNIIQAQLLINQLKHININKLVHMEDVNYVFSPFEGNISSKYPTGIKFVLKQRSR